MRLSRSLLPRPAHALARLLPALVLMVPLAPAAHADDLRSSAAQHQQTQDELQSRIDAADDETRALLVRLREAQQEASRLESYTAEVKPLNADRAARIERQRTALTNLDATREALPGLLRQQVDELQAFIEQDLPFLKEERLARVERLRDNLSNASLSNDERLDQLLNAWKLELSYGQGLDTWRDGLIGAEDTEVQYLRVGRVGLYYLAMDGQHGGAWKTATGSWQVLDDSALAELRLGISMARDQQAPNLVTLPLSVPVESVELEQAGNTSSAVTASPRSEQESS
ncbi:MULTISPECIES: DUF3450 domain-containing protein [Cobetia]|uniref:DUF3450 domain-containing protein n=1 Tax=Cobetia TaxID=204286 RepID=UPI000469DCDE|nr:MULTISPECIES: DUF3450 domain-containing protein [Cobetia]